MTFFTKILSTTMVLLF